MRLVLVALALLLVAGCGAKTPAAVPAHPDPDAAWKADLAALDVHPRNWNNYVVLVKTQTCTNDDYLTYIAVGLDMKSDPAVDRVGLQHACPERLPGWDKAAATAQGYKERGLSLCGPRKKLVERMAIVYKFSAPSVPTNQEILEAAC